MQKQPLRVWLYARTADARPGVLEEQLNSLYREAERRGYTVVNGGAEHRCAGDLDRPALFAMLAAVRGVRAEVKDGEIIVDVYLMVRYGYAIPETARKVQDSVSAAVSGMTGYNVHAVNVHVGGISFN